MRSAFLAILAALFLAAPSSAQIFGSQLAERTIAQLPTCTAAIEGQQYRVTDAVTNLGPFGGGSYRDVFWCHHGTWQPRISLGESIMAPLHNAWRVYAGSPFLNSQELPAGIAESGVNIIWIANDPSVLYGTDCPAGSGYCMWYGLGRNGGGSGVSVYYATSTDGVTWTDGNGGAAVLGPGGVGTWNECGSETPSVIKVGSTWHMAITAYLDPTCADLTKYTMGITTSSDGITWATPTELTELTSIVAPVGDTATADVWGAQTRAEPGLLYVAGDARPFKLVFADVMRITSSPFVSRGISLADSVTGAAGTWAQVGSTPVVVPQRIHDPVVGWQGYSAPAAIKDGSTYHVAASVFRRDGEGIKQRGIATFSGSSLTSLAVENAMAIAADGMTPCRGDVRSPSLVKVGSTLHMYYACDDATGGAFAATTINGADANGNLILRARDQGRLGNGIRVVLNASSGGGSATVSARPNGAWTITLTPASDGTPTAAEAASWINAQADVHELIHATAGGTGASTHGTSAGVNLSGGVGPPLTIGIGRASRL